MAKLQQLQQELNRVHLLMGKGPPLQQQKDPPKCLCGTACLEAAVAAAAAGADVAAVLQQQQQLPLHGDTIMSEMATFQDLVNDEHKEKKKGFRNFAGKPRCCCCCYCCCCCSSCCCCFRRNRAKLHCCSKGSFRAAAASVPAAVAAACGSAAVSLATAAAFVAAAVVVVACLPRAVCFVFFSQINVIVI